MYKPHTLLLSACLHFVSLKMKFIYSIITHFSKLFPHCQHNLLPSALMAAQLWMVDGYLIGETTSHWAQEGEKTEKKGKDKKQVQKITSPVYFMLIHWQILDSAGKCFHLRSELQLNLMSTSLPSLLAGFRQNKTSSCIVQWRTRSDNMLLKTDTIDIIRSTTSAVPLPKEQIIGIIGTHFQWLHKQICLGYWESILLSLCIDTLSWSRCLWSIINNVKYLTFQINW